MTAKVTHLLIKNKNRRVMESRSSLELVAGKGIRGDASYGRSIRQVLLVSDSTLKEFDLLPGDTRENIVISGMNVDALGPEAVIKIGISSLIVSGPCDPCAKMDELRDGLQSELHGKRGVLARVMTSGDISIGDPVSVLEEDDSRAVHLPPNPIDT